MAGYYAKRVFGGFAVFDADDNQIETYEGTGAMAAAEEKAALLNGEQESPEPETAPDFQRGQYREGRGQV